MRGLAAYGAHFRGDSMGTIVRTFLDEQGQGLAEYGLVLAFVAVLCVAAVSFLGANLKGSLSNVGSQI